MNKNVLTLGLLLFTAWALAAEEKKTIYKYTDENGVTHYTETKPNENYKEADLPQLSIVPSTPIKNTTGTTGQSKQQSTDPLEVTDFEIVTPTNEQNLWGTGNTLTASVTPLNGVQQEIYTIQFSIDGQKQQPAEQTTQVFENIYRGEHKVQAFLLNKYTLKQIKQTKAVTFFIHQNSIK